MDVPIGLVYPSELGYPSGWGCPIELGYPSGPGWPIGSPIDFDHFIGLSSWNWVGFYIASGYPIWLVWIGLASWASLVVRAGLPIAPGYLIVLIRDVLLGYVILARCIGMGVWIIQAGFAILEDCNIRRF